MPSTHIRPQCAGRGFSQATFEMQCNQAEVTSTSRHAAGLLLARSMQQGAYQEADKAEVGILRAKAAEIKDAEDGLAVAVQLVYGLL